MKTPAFRYTLLMLGWLGLAAQGAEPDLKIDTNSAAIARLLAQRLPELHVTHRPMGEEIGRRAWNVFLTYLDRERVYFLQSDIDSFKPHMSTLGDELKKGDVKFAYEVFAVWKDRVTNRCEYVKELVAKGFDMETDEYCERDRRDSLWPRDKEEWDEIWRKRVKNEYVQKVVSEQLAEADPKKPAKKSKGKPDEAVVNGYKQFVTMVEKTDSERVFDGYMNSFTRAYDPHSDFMSPPSLEDFYSEMKLSFAGIGAELTSEDGVTKVQRLVPGGPADRDKREVALKAGDKITAVAQGDGPAVDVRYWPLYKVVRVIRGEKGTKVVLTAIPASDPEGGTTKQVDLIRDEIKIESHAAKHEIAQVTNTAGVVRKLGVLKLPAFYSDTEARRDRKEDYRSSSRDVAKLLLDMNEKGVDGVVLDLRNNGGGDLSEAVQMTGLFIKTGPVVLVKERGRTGFLADDDPAITYSGPLVVLVNRQTASASEILAGALQDYGRAVVVGDSKTHGKGSVQGIVSLAEGERKGSIKVTQGLFYRVSGGSTQLKGVTSDICLPSFFDSPEMGEDHLPNALPWMEVGQVRIVPWGDLRPVVDSLTEKSVKRRSESKKFAVYTNLLSRLEEIRTAEKVPLNLKKRLEAAKAMKEMQEQLKQTGEADDEEGDGAKKEDAKQDRDLVLSETLNILMDLAERTKGEGGKAEAVKERTVPSFVRKDDLPEETVKKVAKFVEALRDPDSKVRRDATDKLKKMGPDIFPVLKAYGNDEDPEVRMTVRELLGR